MRRRISLAPLSISLRARVDEFPSHRSCARAIGISEATLSSVLSQLADGDAQVGVSVACRIATFLGRDPKEEFKLVKLPEEDRAGESSYPRLTVTGASYAARARSASIGIGLPEPPHNGSHTQASPVRTSPSGSADATRRLRVFFSHRIGGDLEGASVTAAASAIKTFLEAHGFDVDDGGSLKGHLGKAARDQIAKCDLFLALITADPTTSGPVVGSDTVVRRASAWVMQEIAMAFALGKEPVLLAEKNVEFGDVQGDKKVHGFTGIEIVSALYEILDELQELAITLDPQRRAE